MGIDPEKRYTATLDTSLGEIVIALDAVKAPKTVNNFVFLALDDYYDGVIFHRIIKGFMCQGGDPTGTGRGGPGYRFDDELPGGQYQIGSVAMANAGPNTNGSQFFLISGNDGVRPAAAVQPVRSDREGPRRARDDAPRPAPATATARRGRRHQLGHDHRVRLFGAEADGRARRRTAIVTGAGRGIGAADRLALDAAAARGSPSSPPAPTQRPVATGRTEPARRSGAHPGIDPRSVRRARRRRFSGRPSTRS